MTDFACDPADMHPYECDGPGGCPHCDRELTDDHNPATCALCGGDGEPLEGQETIPL